MHDRHDRQFHCYSEAKMLNSINHEPAGNVFRSQRKYGLASQKRMNPTIVLSSILLALFQLPLSLFGATHAEGPASVPWSAIGARASADYKGDGLSVSPPPTSARLRCAFQRLEGDVTSEGLWLTSTVTNT